jgi:dihydroorotate dehydrogenase electron transfer subunit
MGVAPLLALAEKLKQNKQGKVIIIAGAKCQEGLVREKELKRAADQLLLATDDGSCGQKGFVSEVLLNLLDKETGIKEAALYACGPKPMLKALAVIAKAQEIPAQLSLEERMACGIGACKGCAVKTTGGYKMACKDGPVFAAEEIIW